MEYRRLIHFFGLKRSGNHAIQNWISHQIPEPIAVYNNHTTTASFRVTKAEDLNAPSLHTGSFGGNESLMYTYEDYPLRGANHAQPLTPEEFRGLGDFDEVTNIILLRDPFNNLCSRVRSSLNNDPLTPVPLRLYDPFRKLWVLYAKEVQGETSYLFDESVTPMTKVSILYNKWFTDQEYRKEISKKLGLEFNDNGLQYVNDFGFGSSFDKKNYQGNAQAMKVNERWKQMMEGKPARNLMKKLRADSELMHSVEALFPDIYKEIIEEKGL